MSEVKRELRYGKNVEWFLSELSYHENDCIEQGSIEIYGEDENGAEGSCYVYIPLLAADAVQIISELRDQLAQRDAQVAALDSGLSTLAGAMLNRTLDSGRKQAVAYAECADMVAKFAKQLREGE